LDQQNLVFLEDDRSDSDDRPIRIFSFHERSFKESP
jgi:hypothetical protein